MHLTMTAHVINLVTLIYDLCGWLGVNQQWSIYLWSKLLPLNYVVSAQYAITCLFKPRKRMFLLLFFHYYFYYLVLDYCTSFVAAPQHLVNRLQKVYNNAVQECHFLAFRDKPVKTQQGQCNSGRIRQWSLVQRNVHVWCHCWCNYTRLCYDWLMGIVSVSSWDAYCQPCGLSSQSSGNA